jgi:hypothetical protein
VRPLLPHLPDHLIFDEPCAGDGSLIDALGPHGHVCWRASDIEPAAGDIEPQDALNISCTEAEMFITNPPWNWETLNALISHLVQIAPAWLLLNADVMHNKRMAPHMKRCVKIASIGRISWMQNGQSGYENCVWMLFDTNHTGVTQFIGRELSK